MLDASLAWLSAWIAQRFGAPPTAVLLDESHLSRTIALSLDSGQHIVVKLRSATARALACIRVQDHLYAHGFPCPRPLTEPTAHDGLLVTVEEYVGGGGVFPSDRPVAPAFSSLFAQLLEAAPQSPAR